MNSSPAQFEKLGRDWNKFASTPSGTGPFKLDKLMPRAWPDTGYLLNTAIFQRDIPLLQGTILVLCMFFVALNLLGDILQPLIDPRMGRA